MSNKFYQLYPKAVLDLENIYTYSVKEFGQSRAEEYIRSLEASFENLLKSPEVGRKCDYIRSKLRAYNVGSHIVFFKEISFGIVIIRILHKSMDFNRHI